MDEARQEQAEVDEKGAPTPRRRAVDHGGKPGREAPAEVGPHGFRVTYDDDGNRIEWTRDEPEGQEYPMIVRRGDGPVGDAEQEHWWKVWYHRHMETCRRVEDGDPSFTDEVKRVIEHSKKTARRIEREHGKRALKEMSDFEWGIEYGRLSALAWVLGAEWNRSLDT